MRRKPRPLNKMNRMNPISIDPEIMHGIPCFAGTRVPIKALFDYLSRNHPLNDFSLDFPAVTHAQAVALLHLASAKIGTHTTKTTR